MSAPRPSILVIAGPTASGKTELALRFAEAFDGELIGADSVQIYRGVDIGSAKPTAAELRGISHHMVDVLDPGDPIDAARYAALADAAIEHARRHHRLPIVVGGTGLWLRALLRGLVDLPQPDPDLRAKLEEEAQTLGAESFFTKLERIDPVSARAIHPRDIVRVTRALEVFHQTGRPLGELRAAHALGEPRYSATMCVTDLPADELTHRVEQRIATMMERGWLDETRQLLGRWGASVRPLRSVGYRQLVEHLENDEPLSETIRRIRKATRTYARRQRTWFRSEPGVGFRGHVDALWGKRQEIHAKVVH